MLSTDSRIARIGRPRRACRLLHFKASSLDWLSEGEITTVSEPGVEYALCIPRMAPTVDFPSCPLTLQATRGARLSHTARSQSASSIPSCLASSTGVGPSPTLPTYHRLSTP